MLMFNLILKYKLNTMLYVSVDFSGIFVTTIIHTHYFPVQGMHRLMVLGLPEAFE